MSLAWHFHLEVPLFLGLCKGFFHLDFVDLIESFEIPFPVKLSSWQPLKALILIVNSLVLTKRLPL
jgi:hypothetical protein